MKSRLRLVNALILLVAALISVRVFGAPSDPVTATEKIKDRVAQYYAAVQSNDIAKAKELVLSKSRNTFSPQFGNKLIGVRVAEVDLEKDNVSAVVKVLFQVMVPSIMQTVDVPEYYRWKLDSGDWYFDPADPPPTPASVMRKYYWEKQKLKASKDPSQWDVRFDKEVQDFGMTVKGTTVALSFSFTNQTPQDLRVEKVLVHEVMKDLTQTRVVPAGKRGEIVISLDTTQLYREFEQDVFVQFEPIQEMVKLRIKGRVFTAKDLEGYKPNS